MIQSYMRFVNTVAEHRHHENLIRLTLYALPVFVALIIVSAVLRSDIWQEALIAVILIVLIVAGIHLRTNFRLSHLFMRHNVYADEASFLDEDGTPTPYDALFHVKRFWKRAVVGLSAGILGLCLLLALLFAPLNPLSASAVLFAGFLMVVIGVYITARERARFKREPMYCSPKDGLLILHQANSIKWLLRGSDPDPYSLDEFVLFTPQKTFWEWLIFRNSQTLHIKTSPSPTAQVLLEIKDVRHVGHLIAIQKYRQALQAQEVEQTKNIVEILETQIEILQEQDTHAKLVIALLLESFQRSDGDINTLIENLKQLDGDVTGLKSVLGRWNDETTTLPPLPEVP